MGAIADKYADEIPPTPLGPEVKVVSVSLPQFTPSAEKVRQILPSLSTSLFHPWWKTVTPPNPTTAAGEHDKSKPPGGSTGVSWDQAPGAPTLSYCVHQSVLLPPYPWWKTAIGIVTSIFS